MDFQGFSYEFRPGRSPHQALDALNVGLVRRKVGWVLDADIRSFFDRMSHEWIMQFVQHRVADHRILRLIRKWLVVRYADDLVVGFEHRADADLCGGVPDKRHHYATKILGSASL